METLWYIHVLISFGPKTTINCKNSNKNSLSEIKPYTMQEKIEIKSFKVFHI